jgi:hypothetical protein
MLSFAAADKAESEKAPPAPIATHRYDSLLRNTDTDIDLIVVWPAVTLGANAVLFVPAAIMTAANGWASIRGAYQRLVGEPGEYCSSCPLGEF